MKYPHTHIASRSGYRKRFPRACLSVGKGGTRVAFQRLLTHPLDATPVHHLLLRGARFKHCVEGECLVLAIVVDLELDGDYYHMNVGGWVGYTTTHCLI